MKRQFVSTCYLLDQRKFFLHFHEKHQKWLPPGGHLEENETPSEAARREVLEETGLEIAFIQEEHLVYDEWNGHSIPRPFACLLESIPQRGNEPAHEHIDCIFVARPTGGTLTQGRWFTLEEVMELKPHDEIFLDTQLVIQKLSKLYSDVSDPAELPTRAP